MVFLILSILAVVPAAGLGIDVSILYLVKAKLTQACDGAALAAARNLNLGVTMAEQAAGAAQRAQSYYKANYPASYLGSTRYDAVINVPVVTPGQALTVTTTGSADVRTFFMRLLGTSTVRVTATGTASRKSLNMMMVLDRSSSMSATDAGKDSKGNNLSRVAAMVTAANSFVDKFSAMDRIGLIYFGSDSVLAFTPGYDYQTRSPNNIKYYINQITAGDNTATALAFWNAYVQIVNLHQPSASNVIVLFTDGVPNGVYATFNVKTLQDKRYNIDGSSTLTTYAASSCSGSTISGVVTQTSGFAANGKTNGLFNPVGTASANHAATYMNPSGCASSGSGNATKVRQDVAYIPDTDANGNKFRGYGSDYQTFTSSDQGLSYGDFQSSVYPNNIRVDSPWVIGKASKNSLDHAAIRIRNRALESTIGVTIYVIGFGSGSTMEDPDDTLMMRVANVNDPSNTIFVNDPNVPVGMYVKATGGTIGAAFDRIASEVLRLSR
jgi:Flp pilus assembly protein TadG